MSSDAAGVQSTAPTFYQAANAGNSISVKAAEQAHRSKMEANSGESGSSAEPAKISNTTRPGK
jgi:hypothetical protein